MDRNTSRFSPEHAAMNGLVNLTLTPTTGGRIRNVSMVSYQSSGHFGECVRKFVGDEMDEFLNSQGLVRRSLPGRLEETFFRAVAEAIYHSQTAEEVTSVEQNVREHLEMIRKSRRIADGSPGPKDPLDLVKSASDLYRLTIIIYHFPSQPPTEITPVYSPGEKTSKLYLYALGHKYEYVYPKKTHESLAITQGILYTDLYSDVFSFNKHDLNDVVKKVRRDAEISGEVRSSDSTGSLTTDYDHVSSALPLTLSGPPLIPYSAAKSIDPSIYRNVAFDLANKAIKLQKAGDDLQSHVKFPPESHCLAKRGGRFEYAKVVEIVADGVRLVQFLDNSRLRIGTCDLRGRGMLYRGASQSDARNPPSDTKRPPPLRPIDCSLPPPIIFGTTPLMFTPLYASQSVTAPPSPAVFPNGAVAFTLPPTYYVNQCQSANYSSVEQYLHPESPHCTWWNKNIGRSNNDVPVYQEWSSMNPSLQSDLPNSTMDSGSDHLTPPGSHGSDSMISEETVSPASNADEFNVPYITEEQYTLVDKSAKYSEIESGDDLPEDKATLRYFFNLGLATYQNELSTSLGDNDLPGDSLMSESISQVAPVFYESAPPPCFIPLPHFDDSMATPSSGPSTPLMPPDFYMPQFSPAYSMNSPTAFSKDGSGTVFFS